MRTYVITHDNYDHLIPGFAYLFNKYWDPNMEVTVLGFRDIPDLPANFTMELLTGSQDMANWTNALRPVFERSRAEHVCILLDDYWLIEHVDRHKVAELAIEATGLGCINPAPVKMDLSDNTYNFGATPKGDFYAGNPEAKYRTSLQPAIWRTDYFLRFLQPDWSPWDFERLGSRQANQDKDMAIIGYNEPVYRYANIYKKGKLDRKQMGKMPKEDRDELSLRFNFPGYQAIVGDE